MTDTAETTADDLVTEEMVSMAAGLLFGGPRRAEDYQAVRVILRAVAPMIAARADPYKRREREHIECAIAAEREACAQIVEGARYDDFVSGYIAPAIRARGETTT
jgi:hypothetical protein